MVRTLMWITSGIIAGLIIHLVVILSMPGLATKDMWSRIKEMGSENKITVLDRVEPAAPNPFGLDPKLITGVCQLSLDAGPALVIGTMPDTFWSVSVFDRSGVSIYSTTNRSAVGNVLELGIFNTSQTRLLAEQQLDIETGFLVAQSAGNEVFVTVRIAPPHDAGRSRYEDQMRALKCTGKPAT